MKTQFLGGIPRGTPKNSLFIIKYFQKLENICTFFEMFPKTHEKNSKLKQNLEKTQAKIPKTSKTGNSS